MSFQKAEAAYAARLIEMVRGTAWLVDALTQVHALGLSDWCIGAGAIRNLVWDVAHGRSTHRTSASDIDVVFFDANDLAPRREEAIAAMLRRARPALNWEVTNQAAVHTWHAEYFGHAIAPLASLEDAIARWPETATCVGIRLDADDRLHIVAPHGLADVFDLVVRRNASHISPTTYAQRLTDKRFQARWPQLRIVVD